MSFSKRFTGTAVLILAAIAAFPAEQRAREEKQGLDTGIIEGHEKQINQAMLEVGDVLSIAPQDIELTVNVWGHANGDMKGNFGWSLHVTDRPTPGLETPAPTE